MVTIYGAAEPDEKPPSAKKLKKEKKKKVTFEQQREEEVIYGFEGQLYWHSCLCIHCKWTSRTIRSNYTV